MNSLEQILQRVGEYMNSGSFELAIKDYSRAIALDPIHANHYTNRGLAHYSLWKYDKALTDFNKAIKLDPAGAIHWRNRGRLFFSIREYKKAIDDYNKAIASDPDYIVTYEDRAEAWMAVKDYAKAMADYTKVIDVKPNDHWTYNQRGCAFASVNDHQHAIEDFTIAISLEPAAPDSWYNRAKSRTELFKAGKDRNDFRQAIKDYDKAITLDPENIAAYGKRGVLYCSVKEYHNAISDFNKALTLNPHDKVANDGKKTAWIKLEQLSSKDPCIDRRSIRERAAIFLDEIRVAYKKKFQTVKDGYYHGVFIKKWDKRKKRPAVAGIPGWLPLIMPDIAKWAELKMPSNKDLIWVHTLTDEDFFPHLVGIPIKKTLWQSIIGYKTQHGIGEPPIGNVRKFDSVDQLLERVAKRIRLGELDDYLAIGYYNPPTPFEQFNELLRKMVATPASQ